MTFHATVVTLFPEMFPGGLNHSLTGKALTEGKWILDAVQIRDYAEDKHRTVDDTPYGGGAGMVMKPDVVHRALKAAISKSTSERRMVYLTPRGRPLNQSMVREYAANDGGLILLCGRYEGVDHRVIEQWQMDEVSIGDYVLTGGELPAQILLDAVVRLLPDVLGNKESLENESFELGILEYPQYTKPQNWKNKIVPGVLLSGDHQKIANWRQEEAERITRERRPDLWQAFLKSRD
ncbi:MAG: tRNA (guanosine(37)-N1)-methyltransferase TrmD [Candidatus Paracaedibacteraceae bacterium]|nr:tRNA (guanosine(37)-N1)-methyltransferase TrmD [Candidatus Paracaedibacteraceae bacterium]